LGAGNCNSEEGLPGADIKNTGDDACPPSGHSGIVRRHSGALAPERIAGAETGGRQHTATLEDASIQSRRHLLAFHRGERRTDGVTVRRTGVPVSFGALAIPL